MKIHSYLLLILVFTLSHSAYANFSALTPTDVEFYDDAEEWEDVLNLAESEATPGGKKIIQTARSMIANEEIILGSCWDYINAIYDKAGFPYRKRLTPFKSKRPGPYAELSLIQPGDWLYFVNHSYGDVEHSGIFVAWVDDDKEALVISYPGGNREEPARYSTYDLSSVYNIMRPKE